MENTTAYDGILVVIALIILGWGFWMLFSNLISVNDRMK